MPPHPFRKGQQPDAGFLMGSVRGDVGFDRPRLYSRGRGDPLVLLHCLGVDHRFWDFAAQSLGDYFTLLTYDLPGHGAAQVPNTAYAIADVADQLAEIMRDAGVQRAHVAGI